MTTRTPERRTTNLIFIPFIRFRRRVEYGEVSLPDPVLEYAPSQRYVIKGNQAVTIVGEHGASEQRSPIDAATEQHHQGHHQRHRIADRYAAIVEALMAARPDEATSRFDGELATALAESRIDGETARALRWWQRTSVRAAESYAATIVPSFLAIRDEADAHAHAEADEAAASWRRASDVRASLQHCAEAAEAATGADPENAPAAAAATATGLDPEPATEPDAGPAAEPEVAPHAHDVDSRLRIPIVELATAPLLAATAPAIRPTARLAAVPDLATPAIRPSGPSRASGPKHPASEQTQQAIRAAFAPTTAATSDPDPMPSRQPTDLTATTVVTAEGKDYRSHANPATTA